MELRYQQLIQVLFSFITSLLSPSPLLLLHHVPSVTLSTSSPSSRPFCHPLHFFSFITSLLSTLSTSSPSSRPFCHPLHFFSFITSLLSPSPLLLLHHVPSVTLSTSSPSSRPFCHPLHFFSFIIGPIC